ncbi:MAG: DUF3795 domain-containing protein [Fusicatenibacter sp.]|nr:DUF3795 domain-containing protein [Fusicatenibacter sp.]
MQESICGADCASCQWNATCPGCSEEKCFIAKYIKTGGKEKYEEFKQKLIGEFNALDIPGMAKINELHALVGKFVNLEYPLPSGETVQFLDDNSIYLGNQVECEFGEGRCYGLLAGLDFLLVCEYGENGTAPEIVMFKRR